MRLDKWIWAVRMTKTRTQAATACKQGNVKVNGVVTTKAAKTIRIGDRIEVKYKKITQDYEVIGFIQKQTSAEKVAGFFCDHSTPTEESATEFVSAPQKERLEKKHYRKDQGRPVKRERRRFDDFFEEL